jgi:hypothetical protein
MRLCNPVHSIHIIEPLSIYHYFEKPLSTHLGQGSIPPPHVEGERLAYRGMLDCSIATGQIDNTPPVNWQPSSSPTHYSCRRRIVINSNQGKNVFSSDSESERDRETYQRPVNITGSLGSRNADGATRQVYTMCDLGPLTAQTPSLLSATQTGRYSSILRNNKLTLPSGS